jgi:hypothetical protein
MRRLLPLALVLAPAVSFAQPATAPAPRATTPTPPIEDNSFLAEEAYNQERGIVQHISTFMHDPKGRGWLYTFTQEWPAPTILNQLSYTVPVLRADERGASPRVGDVLLNYRRQVSQENGVYFAPRLSLVLPTGSARLGSGTGGIGIQANLPLTLELSPKFVTHSNVGGTYTPRGKTENDARLRVSNVTLAQSFIVLPTPTFNLMLEAIWSRTTSRVTATPASVDLPREQSLILSPGFRFAMNHASGLQIVPGLAFPVTMTGRSGNIDAQTGVFLYLSFEHPFARTQ